MSKEIEEIFKEWLEEKPIAKILVKKNAQMGYIMEFAEYYYQSKITELEQENESLKERQDKCKHDFKEVHYVNDDYTPIGLFGVFCINCEKENKHI